MSLFETFHSLGGISFRENNVLPESGAYALILYWEKPVTLKTGRHGTRVLSPGRYLYAGRASRGLGKRVKRHASRTKKVHWHIDHLTVHPHVHLQDIWLFPGKPDLECKIVRVCFRLKANRIPIAHFGNGDCRENCPSHLLPLDPNEFPINPSPHVALEEFLHKIPFGNSI